MSSSPNQWFVQTDFGALLGPMETAVLTEMARTGALLPKDQVREGPEGAWRSAQELAGLFDGTAKPLFEPDTFQSPPTRDSFKIASSARLLDDLLNSEKENEAQQTSRPQIKPAEELEFELDMP